MNETYEDSNDFLDALHVEEDEILNERRSTCERCERPSTVCWCPFLPDPQLEIHSRVVILQHSNEEKRGIRTALMASRGIANEKCIILSGKKFSGEEKIFQEETLKDIMESPSTYLLYPGPNAIDVKELSSREFGNSMTFIALDGSWDEAKKLFVRSPCLKNAQMAKLTLDTKSAYVVRTQPADFCLSTVESIAKTLEIVEEDNEIFEKLVAPLHALCNFQVNHGAVHHDSKEFKEQNSQFVKKNNWKKKKAMQKVRIPAMTPEIEWKLWLCMGHEINFIDACLIAFSLIILILHILIDKVRNYLPKPIEELFFYGKASLHDSSPLVKAVEVPKNWFKHFYIFASALSIILLGFAISTLVFQNEEPELLSRFVDFVTSRSRPTSSSGSVLLCLTLLCLQTWRRMLECFFVHAKSSAKMNITHYFVGYMHYFCTGFWMYSSAPRVPETPSLSSIDVVMAFIYVYAAVHQFIAHKIFANLRADGNSSKYSIPIGDWFNFVSCPHYLAEIIIYLCFYMMLGTGNLTGFLLFVWVATNQLIVSVISHNWYKEKFKEYPKGRKAVIPFLF